MKHLFKTQRSQRVKPEQKPQLSGTFGKYPKSADGLTKEVERASLYVMSQLEIQNQSRDLLFSSDGQERLNACLSELRATRLHQRLFVWEPESTEKKKDFMQSLLIIIVIVGFLFLSNFYRQ